MSGGFGFIDTGGYLLDRVEFSEIEFLPDDFFPAHRKTTAGKIDFRINQRRSA
jgi:hypothetical protein